MNTRTWQRAGIGTLCGRCGATIAKGDPVLRIVMVRGGHTLRFVRCAKCDGPAPPDLPPLVVRSTTIAPSALHRVGTLLPFVDWKTRAAEREREPGEEG